MSMRLKDKVAIVTGGASGIGRATVRRLAIEGAAVVVGDLNAATGEALAEDLRRDGCEATYVRTDVTDEASVAGAVDEAVRRYGQLDVMFNNAGIGRHFVTDEEGWWRLVRVNLTGVFLGIKHAARVMRPRGRGTIISTASVAGTRGTPSAIYGATKAGVISLTAHAAAAYRDDGLRVNAVSPGIVETPFFDPRREDMMRQHWRGAAAAFAADAALRGDENPRMAQFQEHMAGWRRSGRLAKPDDLARVVAFLASDESRFVVGHNLLATGLTTAPHLIQRTLASRAAAVGAERLDGLSDKAAVVATANEPLREALARRLDAEGATVSFLDPARCADAAAVGAGLEAAARERPLALVVFGLRPDRGGELLDTSAEAWDDELRANLRAPTVVAEAAIERLAPGGALVTISDTAGTWGGPGSAAYCATAGALTYHTDYWAAQALARRVRVASLAVEDLSHIRPEPTLGGPASATDVAEVVGHLATAAPGLSGLQLSLQTTHPS